MPSMHFQIQLHAMKLCMSTELEEANFATMLTIRMCVLMCMLVWRADKLYLPEVAPALELHRITCLAQLWNLDVHLDQGNAAGSLQPVVPACSACFAKQLRHPRGHEVV